MDIQNNVENSEAKIIPVATPRLFTVAIQFRKAGRVYTFTSDDETLKVGDPVVVDTEDGSSIGFVAIEPQLKDGGVPAGIKMISRRATAAEVDKYWAHSDKAAEHFVACREKIAERSLPMKLIDAEIVENGGKIIFFFYAEDRVDFRTLVKDLAQSLKLRIEMRQIGSRDEAKLIGSLGPCGRENCCSSHLRQFQSISIAMAKHQGLTPNPAKLTGMCGKLKCCLAYEHAVYEEYRAKLPKGGTSVETPQGSGKIVGHNILKEECIVKLYQDGKETRCHCGQCRVLSHTERDAALQSAKVVQEANEERVRNNRARRDKNGRGNRPQQKPPPPTTPEGVK